MTPVRHLNIKFADNPTNPIKLIARGVEQIMDF